MTAVLPVAAMGMIYKAAAVHVDAGQRRQGGS
jgi:hypothetical protein